LQQVLFNLTGNAIKFTDNGRVEVEVRAPPGEEARVEFAVRDTGIGIDASRLETIFAPFVQADASMARRYGGSGLGLSICKSLVEMMGGRVWAESELGLGSTFYLTLPVVLAKELPPEPAPPTAIAPTPAKQLSVLLVEDNPANQKLAKYVLEDRGHKVQTAGDGQVALDLTAENRYDVILMDVQMPGMSGFEATAALRQRESQGRLAVGDGGVHAAEQPATAALATLTPNPQSLSPPSRTPIIAMTAHAMQGDRERCLAAGMDAYLAKPINAQEMIGVVEGLALASSSNLNATPALADSAAHATRQGDAGYARVFDPVTALECCLGKRELVAQMIQYFFDDVETILPQVRLALDRGDLMEVGKLGHRLRGTISHLAAESAKKAALRVERFCKPGIGDLSDAKEAVNALEHECIVLKSALQHHPLAATKTSHLF
jgi:CheY-like chemotaxis protein